MVDVFTSMFLLAGGVLLCGGVYGAYNYHQLTRIPLKTPIEVEKGETVAIEATLSEQTPEVEAPFSREHAPLLYWQVDKYKHDDEGTNWHVLEAGTRSPEALKIEADGYTISVETPEPFESSQLPDAGPAPVGPTPHVVTVVDDDETPPEHIGQFEREHDIDSIRSKITSDRSRRRYIEDLFEPGDEITAYGKVEPETGETVSATDFKLTPDGIEFMITKASRSETKRNRLLGTIIAFALGAVLIAVPFVVPL